MRQQANGPIWVFFLLGLILTRIIAAVFIPAITDEAYYFYWGRFLDLGYFDHPPGIAWISTFQSLWPSQAWAARLGTIILGFLSIPILVNYFRLSGLRREESILSALMLSTASLGGLLAGFIATPDIPQLFCWIMALHECAAALNDKKKSRWLSAGFFTGLGIMGKFTMTLIGPVFLFAILAKRKGLRSPWPYLGGLVCVLVLAPYILWLQNNEWITTRFQFGRGLKSEYVLEMQSGSDLPIAEAALVGGKEMRMAQYFTKPDDPLPKPKKVVAPWLKRIQRFGDFIGGQLGLWGLLLIPIVAALWRAKRQSPQWASSSHKYLAYAATFTPLVIFGLLSPFTAVEANWPAMWCIGASLLLAQYCTLSNRKLLLASAANMGLCLLLALHANRPLTGGKNDRLLRETRGYENLAQHLSALNQPVISDTYQNVSQLMFYAPELKTQQWPGIARISEIIRRPAMNPRTWKGLSQGGSFLLLTDNFVPPFIPGATLTGLQEISDCADGRLEATPYDPSVPYARACEKRLHRWSLAQYSIL